jgi:hypothetical protein
VLADDLIGLIPVQPLSPGIPARDISFRCHGDRGIIVGCIE